MRKKAVNSNRYKYESGSDRIFWEGGGQSILHRFAWQQYRTLWAAMLCNAKAHDAKSCNVLRDWVMLNLQISFCCSSRAFVVVNGTLAQGEIEGNVKGDAAQHRHGDVLWCIKILAMCILTAERLCGCIAEIGKSLVIAT